jgi:hypothetical protein
MMAGGMICGATLSRNDAGGTKNSDPVTVRER